ncbi:MAG: GNAT family N-acetyltransferase [Candidatus Paceibacterota bacterium]
MTKIGSFKGERAISKNESAPGIAAVFEDLKKIERFDTDGFDEYNVEGFQTKIVQGGVRPKEVLDAYLEYLVKDTKDQDFSTEEMHFPVAMRAWLHCDYDNAMSFIKEKFDFKCKDSIDFAKKYKFLNWVSVLIFNNAYVDEKVAARTPIVGNERSVFAELKKSLGKEGDSFLLNYFAQDFSDVASGERGSVKGEAIEFKPFVIAPKTFALDRNSHFCIVSRNDLEDTLFVSEPGDYEKLNEIISKIPQGKFLAQETLDELVAYFSPIEIQGKAKQDIDTQLYRKLNEPYHREKIKEVTGIDISTLPISEQFYFLDYLKFADKNKLQKITAFNKNFETTGLRTFLSLAHGGRDMGDKILTLGEKLPNDSAELLFKTYSDMVDATEEVGNLLRESLGEKATPEFINQAKDSLLLGGKDLLEKYAKKANICEDMECDALGQELQERLSLAKRSVFAFSYACKTLVERGKFSFEDFKKAKLAYDKSPLPEAMQAKIIAMHTENTKQYPPKLRDIWRDTLKDGLQNPNPNQLVVSASYEDEVVSAMRVIQREDGSWYGASFNVNPTVQGSRIGTELLKKVIEDLAKDKPFVADCYSENPMLKTYIKKFGFQITKKIPNYHDTGELVYEITIFPKNLES